MISKPDPTAPLDASKLEYKLVKSDRPVPAQNSPEQWSQSYPTDHMLTVTWTSTTGWSNPVIGPFANISVSPLSSVLNYATTCFEGLKVYRGYDGKARLFRPDLNAARLLRSARRLCLPSFDVSEMEALLIKFSEVEAPKWAPVDRPGTFFYLRPVMIATQPALGLQPTHEATFYIAAVSFPNIDQTPIPPRVAAEESGNAVGEEKFTFLKTTTNDNTSTPGLKLDAEVGRAYPGGPGASKVGVNYAPTLLKAEQARAKGFDQVLWLCDTASSADGNSTGPDVDPKNPLVMESGGSNFFVVWKTPTTPSRTQLITATLDRGLILPGVTRQSILEFTRQELASNDEIEVVESDFGILDLVRAGQEGRLLEAFMAGTAYFVSPVKSISYRGVEVQIPVAPASENGSGETGKAKSYTEAIRKFLLDVQYGRREHKWGVVLDEKVRE